MNDLNMPPELQRQFGQLIQRALSARTAALEEAQLQWNQLLTTTDKGQGFRDLLRAEKLVGEATSALAEVLETVVAHLR